MTRTVKNFSGKSPRIPHSADDKKLKSKPPPTAPAASSDGDAKILAPPTPAVVAARIELQEWLAGNWLRRADPLMVTSKLLAVAVREARTFLDPGALTMTLVAIGMTPESMSEDDLITCIGNLLIDAKRS